MATQKITDFNFDEEDEDEEEAEESREMLADLTWKGTRYPLFEGENYIGREKGLEVVIEEDSVSSKHAKIRVSGNYAVLTDLRSSNGTQIEQLPVGSNKFTAVPSDKERNIHDGIKIRFGRVCCTFRYIAKAGSQQAEANKQKKAAFETQMLDLDDLNDDDDEDDDKTVDLEDEAEVMAPPPPRPAPPVVAAVVQKKATKIIVSAKPNPTGSAELPTQMDLEFHANHDDDDEDEEEEEEHTAEQLMPVDEEEEESSAAEDEDDDSDDDDEMSQDLLGGADDDDDDDDDDEVNEDDDAMDVVADPPARSPVAVVAVVFAVPEPPPPPAPPAKTRMLPNTVASSSSRAAVPAAANGNNNNNSKKRSAKRFLTDSTDDEEVDETIASPPPRRQPPPAALLASNNSNNNNNGEDRSAKKSRIRFAQDDEEEEWDPNPAPAQPVPVAVPAPAPQPAPAVVEPPPKRHASHPPPLQPQPAAIAPVVQAQAPPQPQPQPEVVAAEPVVQAPSQEEPPVAVAANEALPALAKASARGRGGRQAKTVAAVEEPVEEEQAPQPAAPAPEQAPAAAPKKGRGRKAANVEAVQEEEAPAAQAAPAPASAPAIAAVARRSRGSAAAAAAAVAAVAVTEPPPAAEEDGAEPVAAAAAGGAIHLMFTKVEESKYKKELKKLSDHITITDDPETATHIITLTELKRTPKLMMALNCSVKYVLSEDWLKDSAKAGHPLPVIPLHEGNFAHAHDSPALRQQLQQALQGSKYLIQDREKEALWQFHMIRTLTFIRFQCDENNTRIHNKVFASIAVLVTKGVCGKTAPEEDETKRIIETGDGKWCRSVADYHRLGQDRVLVIISEASVARTGVTKAMRDVSRDSGARGVYTMELLFLASLRQHLDLEENVLDGYAF